MNLNIGEHICGFTLTRKRENEKLKGTLYEFTHDKTGAGLCWVDNGAENKLFSVTFKTIPENDTGVFHILEHSVLCGSEKYPTKEPFLELLKSSMNTFLNAMTYPDKTVYPVSSRYEKDYLNLTSVYLDAVFAPRLTADKNVFYQEGRHIELSEEGACFNGVVFNEMKGALSDVNSRLEYGLNALLFPDNCYRFNSGGDPKAITELTYEQYRDTYLRFYHPSNALFFLDGDLPLEKTLGMIEEYLSKYDRKSDFPEIKEQLPKRAEATEYYELEEAGENKDIIARGKLIGHYDDALRCAAAQVLCDLLTFSNDAPIKRAILSRKLAEDIEIFVNDGLYQPFLMTIIRNTDDKKANEIYEVIKDTVRELVEKGIPTEDLLASVNRMEFSFRLIPEPQGLYRMNAVLNSWLYGGDPMLFLDMGPVFSGLHEMMKNGGYEKLLSELFLDDGDVATLHMLPAADISAKAEKEENAKAAALVEAMSDKEREQLAAENEALARWQQDPDSPEAIATLPTLELSDVSETPRYYETEVDYENGMKLLYHHANTNGIIHMTLYASLTEFALEQLSLLSILPSLYGELPTADHDLASLQREIKTYIGRLDFTIAPHAKHRYTKACTPCLVVSASVLEENLQKAEELIIEILTKTDFSDEQKIIDILKQIDEDNRQETISSGHTLGISVVHAAYSAFCAVMEAIGGLTYMRTVHGLLEDFAAGKEKLDNLRGQMENTSLTRSNVTVSITADKMVSLNHLSSALPQGEPLPQSAEYTVDFPKHLGIKIPAMVSYAVKGFHQQECGMEPDGSLKVVANIASLSYLWPKIRVQGGAYGTGFFSVGDRGIACYSYRDPSPAQSLAVYDKVADFIEEFADSGEKLDKYIISTVAGTEPLYTPLQEGHVADDMYFSGRTNELWAKARYEMLHTSKEDLLRWAAAIREMAPKGRVCVIGNADALSKCEGLETIEIFKADR